MIPIVFWASLPPWPSEYSEAETNCRLRNVLATAYGVKRTKTHDTISTSTSASTNPVNGESTMAAAVLLTPLHTMELQPILAQPAPISPPINACELLDGMPRSQVSTFHTIAPIKAPNTT